MVSSVINYEKIAKTYEQQQDWVSALDAWQTVAIHQPDSPLAYWSMGNLYKDQLQDLAKAQSMFAKQIMHFPERASGYEGMAQTYEQLHQYTQALGYWQQVAQKDPKSPKPYWAMGHLYRRLDQYDDALTMFTTQIGKFPERASGYIGRIQLAQQQRQYTQVIELAEAFIVLFPTNWQGYHAKAMALKDLKQLDWAIDYLADTLQHIDKQERLYTGLAHLYVLQRNTAKSIEVLQAGLTKCPSTQPIVKHLIGNYLDYNEADSALNLFNQFISQPDSLSNQLLLARIYRVKEGNDSYVRRLQHLYENNPDEVAIGIAYSNAILDYTLPNGNALSNTDHSSSAKNGQPNLGLVSGEAAVVLPSNHAALQVLQQLSRHYPEHTAVQHSLINACIRVGAHEQARALIRQIPLSNNDSTIQHYRSWLAYQDGNLPLSQALWQDFAHKVYRLEMDGHCEMQALRYCSGQPLAVDANDIVLIVKVRNEMLRLPAFLAHYRKLGIQKFLIIDNDSQDGSLAYLQQQPDCYVFWTAQSHYQSAAGILLLDAVLRTYIRPGQWCIHADADEFLVYPDYETKPLSQLVGYLEQVGADVMQSFMLDMFAKNLTEQLKIRSGDNLLEKAPYFYDNYVWLHQVDCPYIYPMGGIFSLVHSYQWLTKVSLFRYHAGLKFWAATHAVSPSQVANVTSAYLHFKLVGDFMAKSQAEIRRKEYAYGGLSYSANVKLYEVLQLQDGADMSALPKTRRYQSSEQLVELGLLKTTLAWQTFNATNVK